MGRYILTGATGLIGRRLTAALISRGDEVQALCRDVESARRTLGPQVEIVAADLSTPGPWTRGIDGATGVVHLAGESIFGKRWSEARKQRLWASRVESAATLALAIRRAAKPPAVFVSGSAVGYYGARRDEKVDESATPGRDFLARLSLAWEDAARQADAFTRVVLLRTGIVLDEGGGALQTMALPFKLGVGGPVGDGRQGFSWIHHTDMLALILRTLDDPGLVGPVNGTSPQPVTNREFARALAKQLGRPCLVGVPALALRITLGEVAEVMAGGQWALPQAAWQAGFKFRFGDVREALADIYGPKSSIPSTS